MAAVMQQIAMRSGQKRGKDKIKVRNVAGEPTRHQQQLPAHPLSIDVFFFGQRAVNQFACGQADYRMSDIIH